VSMFIVVSELFRGEIGVARDEEDDGVSHDGQREAAQRAGKVLWRCDESCSMGCKDSGVLTAAVSAGGFQKLSARETTGFCSFLATVDAKTS
jgi:hypothetical protein